MKGGGGRAALPAGRGPQPGFQPPVTPPRPAPSHCRSQYTLTRQMITPFISIIRRTCCTQSGDCLFRLTAAFVRYHTSRNPAAPRSEPGRPGASPFQSTPVLKFPQLNSEMSSQGRCLPIY